MADLSEVDQQFLDELLVKEAGREMVMCDATAGQISGPITCEDAQWTYLVYLPKGFLMARK
ncbi:MAG: hypothetical protein ABGY95_07625 [Rubritalea sp.]|uniref:hypothetical protein n=1 Tax=Rubritalea sp. TaxID=2109375 RepID=UPI003242DBBD